MQRILAAFYRDAIHAVGRINLRGIELHHSASTSTNPPQLPAKFADAIPAAIASRISSSHMTDEYRLEMSLQPRHKIALLFVAESSHPNVRQSVGFMLQWLSMIYEWSSGRNRSGQCPLPSLLTCRVYWTAIKKILPAANAAAIADIHANTAFTQTCAQPTNEIVIYRREEWFKVFIHETLHAFGLDFSAAHGSSSLRQAHDDILRLFGNITSDVNLYEAYTECWAELINCMFAALAATNSATEFRKHAATLIAKEAAHGRATMSRVLAHYNGATLADMMSGKLRDIYREETSVLSYYIIKNILLTHYDVFFAWIVAENGGDIRFLDYVKFPQQNGRDSLGSFCDLVAECAAAMAAEDVSRHATANGRSNRSMRMSVTDVAAIV